MIKTQDFKRDGKFQRVEISGIPSLAHKAAKKLDSFLREKHEKVEKLRLSDKSIDIMSAKEGEILKAIMIFTNCHLYIDEFMTMTVVGSWKNFKLTEMIIQEFEDFGESEILKKGISKEEDSKFQLLPTLSLLLPNSSMQLFVEKIQEKSQSFCDIVEPNVVKVTGTLYAVALARHFIQILCGVLDDSTNFIFSFENYGFLSDSFQEIQLFDLGEKSLKDSRDEVDKLDRKNGTDMAVEQ